ncbi:MAG: M23 family metallopeptidase [Actinobacteria bacterium]|nr:M23 family metallopeptidase [Actinomycetota bacterium]
MQDGAYAAEIQRRDEALRRKRRRASVYRRRRTRFALAFAGVCVFVACIVVIATAGGTMTRVDSGVLLERSPSAPVAATGQERPAFARMGDRNLLLPVAAGDATIIAYQTVIDERAVALTPLGEQANANAVVRFFRDTFSSDPLVRYYLLEGADAKNATSVKVGAAAGSAVYAPITGVVCSVKEYLLYGKYTDVEIGIRPEKSSGLKVTMLFVSDPVVSIGDIVTAGKTRLGSVRQCPEELGAGLSVFTHEAGAHIHLQVTEEPVN